VWYLFRTGPNDREGSYVTSFPSLDAVRRMVEDVAAERNKKLVIRQSESGVQFIVKGKEPTWENLVGAVVYTASRDKSRPVVKPPQMKVGGRILKPGEPVPARFLKYLEVDPFAGEKE
jgi:hypothetical protein